MTRSINIAFAIAAILIGVSVTSRVSYGGLLDSVGGMLNNNNSPSVGPPTEELERNLSSLDVRFAGAMREMLTAQSITADALGDKASADRLATEAAALEGKTDINTVERSISISEEAAKTNQEKMAAAGALNQQAKAELATAAGHYARGMVQAAGLPREYQNWLSGAKAKADSIKANPIEAMGAAGFLRDVVDVVLVTRELPDLISTWYDSTKNFVQFAKGNGVDTGDLSSKI